MPLSGGRAQTGCRDYFREKKVDDLDREREKNGGGGKEKPGEERKLGGDK